MTGRREDKKNSNKGGQTTTPRQSQFFIDGEGIDREVITTDICRYLGNDALVRPGTHKDQNTGRVREGFYITAYRPPTSAQLADLRADSQKWQEERRRNRTGGYTESVTRREMWGPNPDEPQQQQMGGYQAPGYGGMPPATAPAPPRPYETGRVGYPNPSTTMPPPGPAVGYAREPVSYAPTTGMNYTFTQPPSANPLVAYSVETRTDRMGEPPRNIPPNSGYLPPGGGQQVLSGYPPGRNNQQTYSYPPVGGPSVPQTYNAQDPYNPYNPRDQVNPQENVYDGNDDDMDYEESPGPTPAPAPRRGAGDRERDQEPSRKHRHHR